ncbi:MAG: protease complex subunit PrcB family protein, partial [Gemmatimonadota bacterium]|nr:protease complex subunit PrcB family protein [Gemmatimonadota bacterium]
MIPRRIALLIPIVALAGCAAGSTLRVAEGGEATANEPVSLAPAPAAEPQEAAAAPPAPGPETASTADTAGVTPQGYAPYGNAGPLEIQRIGQWTRTGIGEARRLVIKDANSWAQFWSELGVGERPAVDFTRDVVVAAAAGQRPTGGHEIAIDRVTRTDGELTVEV